MTARITHVDAVTKISAAAVQDIINDLMLPRCYTIGFPKIIPVQRARQALAIQNGIIDQRLGNAPV